MHAHAIAINTILTIYIWVLNSTSEKVDEKM